MQLDPVVLKCLTWNCEGLKRNYLSLSDFACNLKPDLILLSEPNVFSHDLPHLMKYFTPQYKYYLNSEDRYDKELPFVKNQAYGGTMAMWKAEHDAHITVHPVLTTSYQLPPCHILSPRLTCFSSCCSIPPDLWPGNRVC